MSSRNLSIVLGRIGQDPTVSELPSGQVVNFTVATNEKWNDKVSGERKERTEWHNVVVWNQTAEWAAKNLKKGDIVYVEGPMQTRKFEDKNGQQKSITEIKARSVQKVYTEKVESNGNQ